MNIKLDSFTTLCSVYKLNYFKTKINNFLIYLFKTFTYYCLFN